MPNIKQICQRLYGNYSKIEKGEVVFGPHCIYRDILALVIFFMKFCYYLRYAYQCWPDSGTTDDDEKA